MTRLFPAPVPNPLRGLRYAATLLTLTAIVAACADKATAPSSTSAIAPSARSESSESGQSGQSGGQSDRSRCTTGTSVPLVAESMSDDRSGVGTVSVANSPSAIDVTFTTARGWTLKSTAAIVAASAEDISRRVGRGADKQLPATAVPDGATSYTVSVPLADVGRNRDGTLIVVARAIVAGTTRENGQSKRVETVAWGEDQSHGKREGAHYFVYRVQQCGGGSEQNGNHDDGNREKGYATITFDDGFLSTYTYAYPILKKYGLTANIAINSRPIDEHWDGYMTFAMVRQLSGEGWAVVNHTVDHKDLKTLSEAEVAQEITVNRDWIDKNGFRGSNVFVVPFHSWGARERSIVTRYEFAARGAAANQFRPVPFDSLVTWPASANRYGLTGLEPFAPTTTFATAMVDLRRYLEMVRRNGRFIDVFFHRIEPTDVAEFEQLARVMAEYRDVIRTYDKLFPAGGNVARR